MAGSNDQQVFERRRRPPPPALLDVRVSKGKWIQGLLWSSPRTNQATPKVVAHVQSEEKRALVLIFLQPTSHALCRVSVCVCAHLATYPRWTRERKETTRPEHYAYACACVRASADAPMRQWSLCSCHCARQTRVNTPIKSCCFAKCCLFVCLA